MGWRIASTPVLGDAYIEAVVKMGACSTSDGYGLVFRVPEQVAYNQGYFFGITCDGKYSLRVWNGLVGANGMTTWLQYPKLSEFIIKGKDASNTLGVMTVGDDISLYINGELVAEFEDDTYPQGFFGMFINRDNTENLTINIDRASYWTDPLRRINERNLKGGISPPSYCLNNIPCVKILGIMMPTHSFIAVFLFSFSLAIGAVLTPGPVTTAIISQSPRLGWKAGLLVSIGHAIMELLMVILITLGLSELLGSPRMQIVIALLGGLLLLYMGGVCCWTLAKGRMILPQKEEGANRKTLAADAVGHPYLAQQPFLVCLVDDRSRCLSLAGQSGGLAGCGRILSRAYQCGLHLERAPFCGGWRRAQIHQQPLLCCIDRGLRCLPDLSLRDIFMVGFQGMCDIAMTETIYFAENLKILASLPDASIQLIYIDPPFNTGR